MLLRLRRQGRTHSTVVTFMACGEYLLTSHSRAFPLGAPPSELVNSLLTSCAPAGMCGDQVRDGLPMARYHDGLALLHGAQQFGKSSFGLG